MSADQKISAYDKQAQTVADFFLDGFRNNTSMWTKPWTGLDVIADPYNPTTGKRYRGGNHFSLLAAQMAMTMEGKTDGRDCRWATFKQSLGIGASVRKGEKGTLLVSYNEVTDERRPAKSDEEPHKRLIANAFYVFHASQMDGLPELPRAPERTLDEQIKVGQELIDKSGAVVIHGGNFAAFDPKNDRILMPDRGSFFDDGAWMATTLHELGHWSGGKGRLERKFSFDRKSPDYAREELRAEMSSFAMCQRLGVPFDPSSHQSYVNSWITLLENDPREILRAASDVEKILTQLQVPERVYEILPQIEKVQEQERKDPLAKQELTDPHAGQRRARVQKDRSREQSLSL